MSVNKFQPHLIVLPEDDANRQIALGFRENFNLNSKVIHVLPPAGGWMKVIEQFTSYHAQEMQKFSRRMFVLLIDFDDIESRFPHVQNQIPEDLQSRVFILGVRSNPEQLRRATEKTFEEIGETLAEDCANNHRNLWEHPLLEQNRPELERMIEFVKPFLFSIDP